MSDLKRHMGLFQLTMYGVGMILGAGIYVLIGQAAGLAGGTIWISVGLGVVLALFSGLSYAELSSIFPKSAAEYVFVKKSFKNNLLAFIVGWLTAITSVISAAVVSLGFGGYLANFVDIPIVVSAIILLGLLSLVNFLGIKESAWTNTVFTIIEASGLILIIVIGFTYADPQPVDYFESPTGLTGILLAFTLIFFAFIGFEDMANVAEEVKNPKRTLPRAIILSVLITGIIYVLVSFASIRVVDWHDLGTSIAPMADVADTVLGAKGHVILSGIALFATVNTVLIILVAGARMFYGMAREQSLPTFLSIVHSKTKTPWISVIVVMLLAIAFTLIGDIAVIAQITVFATLITFAMINLSVIILRYTETNIERPYKIPLNIGKFPIFPLFGLSITVYMLFQFELDVLLVGAIVLIVGVILYFVLKNKVIKSK